MNIPESQEQSSADLIRIAGMWFEAKDRALTELAAAFESSTEGLDIEIVVQVLENDKLRRRVTLVIDGALSGVTMDEALAQAELLTRLGIQDIIVHGYDTAIVEMPSTVNHTDHGIPSSSERQDALPDGFGRSRSMENRVRELEVIVEDWRSAVRQVLMARYQPVDAETTAAAFQRLRGLLGEAMY